MSEEVTYADLKFQDSSKTGKIQEFDKFGIKVPPAASHVWRQRAWALTLLCLLLLIGLGVLGSLFYITSKIHMEKLNKLQNFKEELQRNVSLQLMHNMNSSEKIRNLSITLQETATKLCHELYTKIPEHKCKPCPKKWMWHEDRCYIQFMHYETWQKSDKICSDHNASLLKITNKSMLEFIKSLRLYDYWLGLSPRKYKNGYKILDETIISSNWFTRNTNDLDDWMYCGYTENTYVYHTRCTETKRIICEKLANPVKIESILMSEVPEA
ncbi:C-type lectin domain family 12 member A [Balaenoptera musculus]|uniref:C-type lectin domain family 12 member A n=1 Tax=Balaenoptera musculus TaxID=9771 RepID=A0A8C0DZU1_BALMU|nr:C-type lectin domain family 12 member A [Balaenoptera musculus]XP_036721169.1 C-type lectin domain family 12 member A [Balaenoptera musculus]XP_036721170.1 C-type lectin domain family 12 member A [Balaenoptera musculus]